MLIMMKWGEEDGVFIVRGNAPRNDRFWLVVHVGAACMNIRAGEAISPPLFKHSYPSFFVFLYGSFFFPVKTFVFQLGNMRKITWHTLGTLFTVVVGLDQGPWKWAGFEPFRVIPFPLVARFFWGKRFLLQLSLRLNEFLTWKRKR